MNDDYMISFQNETKQTIEASYKKMTAVERSVADFFIGNKDDMDFSSKNISRVLYVSEATLSRFSQKCGYKGYREFIFSYERDLKIEQKSEGTEKDVGLFARRVQNSYQKLLQENFRILDEEQVRRVAVTLRCVRLVSPEAPGRHETRPAGAPCSWKRSLWAAVCISDPIIAICHNSRFAAKAHIRPLRTLKL